MAAQGAGSSIPPIATGAQQAVGGAAVEMKALPPASSSAPISELHNADRIDPSTSMAQPDGHTQVAPVFTTAAPAIDTHATPSQATPLDPASAVASFPIPLTRQQTEALGPATEIDLFAPAASAAGPALNISLMLTTGAKHPYKIDEKYLTNRNAVAKSAKADGVFDPMAITGYKLKELIWTDWRKEWEPRPASPSAIRLITMGKMVDDKKMLNDYSFGMDKTNVVHMTVKPADFGEDEETAGKHGAKGGSIRTRDGGESGAGCRCVIL
ncbi:hypothetical protein LTR35_011619 [Friedmanniomyces endolithicus]|uniref:UBL3-like ubiquitin domain-containing protein n=1 Tax=Friedmanniomyces endolithicus TaxID=329885 RepID=A0AAN6FFF2_9PEZI|nr:hypothetical protein LTR35_011619 [Friedmanniomyces endolithicus]KAK0287754.1 hypothetical protein LTS00_009866 [Friedmanniomyces endolithicus]KAK0314954.1 hypothetical protein LTR82_012948 [Friedmanniomyces endolithicus]KAK0994628.1 hypothetical protein LTR54_010725 [Friedmanniomyces endolithicus]